MDKKILIGLAVIGGGLAVYFMSKKKDEEGAAPDFVPSDAVRETATSAQAMTASSGGGGGGGGGGGPIDTGSSEPTTTSSDMTRSEQAAGSTASIGDQKATASDLATQGRVADQLKRERKFEPGLPKSPFDRRGGSSRPPSRQQRRGGGSGGGRTQIPDAPAAEAPKNKWQADTYIDKAKKQSTPDGGKSKWQASTYMQTAPAPEAPAPEAPAPDAPAPAPAPRGRGGKGYKPGGRRGLNGVDLSAPMHVAGGTFFRF